MHRFDAMDIPRAGSVALQLQQAQPAAATVTSPIRRIGVCSVRDLRSPRASTHHYIWQALRFGRHCPQAITPFAGPWKFVARRQNRGARDQRLSRLIQSVDARCGSNGDPLLMLHASSVVGEICERLRAPYVHISDLTARQLSADYPGAFASKRAFEEAEAQDRRTAQVAHLCLYPSRWAADDAIDAYGLSPERVAAIPWGGGMEEHAEQFEAPEWRWESPVLEMLSIGYASQRKGFDTAVAAVAKLNRLGIPCRLTVIGVDQQPDAPENVVFAGRLSQAADMDAIQRILRRSMLLLHPARGEAYGHAIVEAMAHAIPVLGTRVGAMPELIEHGGCGLLMGRPGNSAELADMISSLNQDRGRLRAMGIAARARWENRLRWRHWVSDLQELLSGCPRSARARSQAVSDRMAEAIGGKAVAVS